MKDFNVSEICGKAWQIFKENWLMLTAVMVVIMIVQNVISSIFGGNPANVVDYNDPQAVLKSLNYGPGQFIGALISECLQFGFAIMMIHIVKGKACDFSIDFWKQEFMSYVNYVVCSFVVGIVVAIGLCLCIIPGIWLASRLCFAPWAIANNPQLGFTDAIKQSWTITNGYSLNIILLGLTFLVIAIAGLLCCCVGVIPASVVISLAECVAFLILASESEPSSCSEPQANGPQTL